MRSVLHLVLAAVVGAVSVALVAFVVQGYLLIRNGVARDTLPLGELASDLMHLEYYALGGALLGVVLATIALVTAASRSRRRRGDLAALRATVADPDALIRLRRAEGARQYLNEGSGDRPGG